MKVPLSLVVRRLVSLVPALMMTTAALGTTPPDGSVTLPLIPPRLVCAKTRVAVSATKIEKSRGARNRCMYESLRLVGHADRRAASLPASECKPSHKLAVARLAIQRCRIDIPKSGSRNTSPIPRLRLRRSRKTRIRQISPIEDIEELRPNLQRPLLPDPEHAAQAHLLHRTPLIAEVAVIRRGRSPIPGSRICPCVPVQNEILVRIYAVAIQVLQVQRNSGHAVHQRVLEKQRTLVRRCRRTRNRKTARVLEQRAKSPALRHCTQQTVLWQRGNLIGETNVEHEGLVEARDRLIHATVEYVVYRTTRVRFRLRPREGRVQRHPFGVALGHFRLQRLVPTIAQRRPNQRNAAELRKWPQGLSERRTPRVPGVRKIESC